MQLSTNDKLMIIIFFITMLMMFIAVYYFNFNGVNGKLRKFISGGGIKIAKLVESNGNNKRYCFEYEGKDYYLDLDLKKDYESVTVYFDINNPNDYLVLEKINKLERMFPSLIPAIAIIILLLAYMLIYRK